MPSGKVLIVEDDPDQAMAVALHLKGAGYTVVTAQDTAAAIVTATRERPDVVLLDLGLPGGGGMTVLARLKTLVETMTVPVIIVSGSGMDREWIFASGAQGYVEKPADPESLVQTIERVRGNPGAD